jgi:transcription antitermination factor NusG
MTINWICLRTKPQKEFAAERYFNGLGYTCYMPAVSRRRNGGGVRHLLIDVKRPLITGYIFLQMPAAIDWPEIFQKYFILSAIGHDGHPWLFSDDIIRKLRWNWNKLGRANDRRFGREIAKFDIGDNVQAMSGPFEGHEIRIEQISGCRAKGIIDALGGQVVIEADVIDLEAA